MEKNFMNRVFKAAGIVAGVAVFFVLLPYSIGVDFTISPLSQWLGFLAMVGALVWVALMERKSMGGFIAFGDLYKFLIITVLFFAIVLGLFEHILFNVMDTEFRDALHEKGMEKTYEALVQFGASEEIIEKSMADAEKRMQSQSSFSGVAMGMGFRTILYGIIGLIICAFVKKKDPEQEF